MKTTTLFIVLNIIAIVSFAGIHKEQDWESKTYELEEFKKLHLEGGYKVYLIQGDENSMVVKASDDDVFDHLEVKENNELLKLKIEREHFNFDRISLYITFKELEEVKIEGGVKLNTEGYLDLNDFYIHVEGGAKIELNMKARDVKVIGEGGVLFELDGVAENLDVKVSGAGHVDADDLKTKNVEFRVAGGTYSDYKDVFGDLPESLREKVVFLGNIDKIIV